MLFRVVIVWQFAYLIGAAQCGRHNQPGDDIMPFDTAVLGDDFMPMNHKTVQPIGALALKIFSETGAEIPGWHHIVRGDNQETIRLAPDSYTVVQNAEAIAMVEDAFT